MVNQNIVNLNREELTLWLMYWLWISTINVDDISLHLLVSVIWCLAWIIVMYSYCEVIGMEKVEWRWNDMEGSGISFVMYLYEYGAWAYELRIHVHYYIIIAFLPSCLLEKWSRVEATMMEHPSGDYSYTHGFTPITYMWPSGKEKFLAFRQRRNI